MSDDYTRADHSELVHAEEDSPISTVCPAHYIPFMHFSQSGRSSEFAYANPSFEQFAIATKLS